MALADGLPRLAVLARVYPVPANIDILDEGTCHLDPAAEDRAERGIP
jgi:ATP-binding cassette subfamily C protein